MASSKASSTSARAGRLTITVSLLLLSGFGLSIAAEAPAREVVSPAVSNYSRVTPAIAAAGVLKEGGVAEVKSLGFATVLDLRGPNEGATLEKPEVESAGLRYLNIPVTAEGPSDEQVGEFAAVLENPKNAPLLVHCQTGSRVGAMWALYRARQGAAPSVALEEGRAIGLRQPRETAIRARLDAMSPLK